MENFLESKGLKVNMRKTKVMILGRDPRIHCKPLVNILVQYAGKGLEKAQSSVVDVCFGFTIFFSMSQVS